ncbi:hypothetical protein DCAR_0624036 [Daucus carota subsp. sativus]|uniref:F-box associated domain-containing protein n=1 Tax=Daucus carota subsp. sativus TaxID=79200 RepID=A0A161ZS01_DAUCS|nr:hypothetical protein DCAR_0624036 [Daucus carota subsp. sativus]
MARKKRRTKKSIKQHKAEEFGKEINQTSLIDILSESLVANVIAGLPIASICAWRLPEPGNNNYTYNGKRKEVYGLGIITKTGNDKVNMSVGMLNNCLCLFDNSHPAHFGIWSMEEYGVRESWALKCILTASIPAGICKSTIHPLAALKDDGFIIKSGSGNFYFYDQKNMNFTRFEIDNVELLAEFNYLTIHSSSFCPIDLMSTGCVLDTEVSARCSAHKSK